ncbi:hypothetical protein AVEN_128704-1 [Araneus ventricosus]|uniref:RNA-directed DNA polymerase from transposon X-element n=1 Tax=Araneus ventricosus TaxID=182803 RepID=A0A4Y2TNX1_ARAVE|nr:hypothetical protein AVEN_128704-1 [Araneus ventricosus]
MNKIKPCSPAEVAEEIEKLKSRKCPGKGRITNLMIKHLPKRAIVRITYLINCIIKLSHFPKSWKSAVVVPIYKPGKNAESPESYRPISLLSSLSKLAESIILNRLEAETEDKEPPFPLSKHKGGHVGYYCYILLLNGTNRLVCTGPYSPSISASGKGCPLRNSSSE